MLALMRLTRSAKAHGAVRHPTCGRSHLRPVPTYGRPHVRPFKTVVSCCNMSRRDATRRVAQCDDGIGPLCAARHGRAGGRNARLCHGAHLCTPRRTHHPRSHASRAHESRWAKCRREGLRLGAVSIGTASLACVAASGAWQYCACMGQRRPAAPSHHRAAVATARTRPHRSGRTQFRGRRSSRPY